MTALSQIYVPSEGEVLSSYLSPHSKRRRGNFLLMHSITLNRPTSGGTTCRSVDLQVCNLQVTNYHLPSHKTTATNKQYKLISLPATAEEAATQSGERPKCQGARREGERGEGGGSV